MTTKANNYNIRRVKRGDIMINYIYLNLEHYYPFFVFRASSINEILEHVRVAATFSCFVGITLVSLSHSHPCSLAHQRQEKCPPRAALEDVPILHWDPFALAYWRTEICPPLAAAAQVEVLHGHPFSLSMSGLCHNSCVIVHCVQ